VIETKKRRVDVVTSEDAAAWLAFPALALALLPRAIAVFPTFHAAHGIGMLASVARALRGRQSVVHS